MEERPPRPSRIRVTGLQDVHLDDVVAIDRSCKELLWRAGVAPSEAPARDLAEIGRLPKLHNVRVAEADALIAGYLAWRDESPGVGVLEELCVRPDLQRYGVGTALLKRGCEEARKIGLSVLLTRHWVKATWAEAFLRVSGFRVKDATAPALVGQWCEEQIANGSPLKEGQIVLWVAP